MGTWPLFGQLLVDAERDRPAHRNWPKADCSCRRRRRPPSAKHVASPAHKLALFCVATQQQQQQQRPKHQVELCEPESSSAIGQMISLASSQLRGGSAHNEQLISSLAALVPAARAGLKFVAHSFHHYNHCVCVRTNSRVASPPARAPDWQTISASNLIDLLPWEDLAQVAATPAPTPSLAPPRTFILTQLSRPFVVVVALVTGVSGNLRRTRCWPSVATRAKPTLNWHSSDVKLA